MLARHGVYNRRHAGNWSNRLGSARMQREIFEIVERSIHRIYGDRIHRDRMDSTTALRRYFWKCVWRANVRMRLVLTLRARLMSGHAEAACAAWNALTDGTGRKLPRLLARAGSSLILWRCGQGKPRLDDVRQSVSPL
jgi:hypothetical protein